MHSGESQTACRPRSTRGDCTGGDCTASIGQACSTLATSLFSGSTDGVLAVAEVGGMQARLLTQMS